jgi:hypothetical protein
MSVFFVDLFSSRIEDLDAAKPRFDCFGEPNPHVRWRRMHFVSDRWIGVRQKTMRADSRSGQN